MSTERTKAQTVQVGIFSTQTEPRKKVHISQLFLKFHMVSFPVSVKSFYLKNQRENGMSTRRPKPKKFLLSYSSWNFTWVLFSRLGKRLWIDISIRAREYGRKIWFFFPQFKQAEPRNFSTSHRSFWNFKWAFHYHIIKKKKTNENRAREHGGIEENRINLIVSVQTRKTQGISTPFTDRSFSP